MSDNKPNEVNNEEAQDKVEDTLNLEEVHAKAVHEIEEDDQKENEEEQEQEEEQQEEEPEDSQESEEDSQDDTEEDSEEAEVPTVPTEEPEEKADPVQAEQEEIPKVVIKDSEGREHEFESAEDIPDDFEPFSYKELAVGTTKLAERQARVRQNAIEAEEKEAEKQRTEAIAKTRAKWESELNDLVKAGMLDKDKNKRQADVDGIYTIMQESINEGSTISSFKQAYEIYKYRKSQEKEDKTVVNEQKKKAGSRVMPGGGSKAPASSKPGGGKVIQAPPSGVSLDAIHDSILSNL